MAWHPLGWTPAFFSEIEKFPSAVLAHRYGSNLPGDAPSTNGVPNLGDMTKFQEWDDHAIELLVGGTPCQSFSVAGLRAGLADPRGNLMLTYLAIAARYQPRWLVWENVPGVLSSNSGRDFGTFLTGLGELGYGFAYRVLDAQFCRAHGHEWAVPQRRRRVFVVGYLGDWRRAAAVLFDTSSLRGDSPPRREAGQRVAPTISARTKGGGGLGTDFDLDGGLISSTGNVAHCLNAGGMGRQDYETETMVAHALRAGGFDASEDGTGRGTPLIPVAPPVAVTLTRGAESSGKGGYAGRRQEDDSNLVAEPIVMMERGRADGPQLETRQDGTANAILTPNGGRGGLGVGAVAFNPKAGGNPTIGKSYLDDGSTYTLDTDCTSVAVQQAWAVRRLTPRECERLQGFPDDFTAIPHRGKPAADGPRYKALGNSMAVNVMRVIGERIAMVEAMQPASEAAA